LVNLAHRRLDAGVTSGLLPQLEVVVVALVGIMGLHLWKKDELRMVKEEW
jgi:hypothetical protein